MSAIVDGLIEFVEQLITTVSYPGIFIGMVLENVFPPLPSEVVMGLSGFMVGKGDLNLWLVVISGTLGTVLAALGFYYLGRSGGRPLLEKWGSKIRISMDDLSYTDQWFDRFGDWVVFFGRFLPIIRTLVSFPAGLMKMPLPKFLLLTVIPSFVWCLGLAFAGMQLGENWEDVGVYLEKAEYATAAFLVVGLVVIVYLKREQILKKFFPDKQS